MAGGQTPRHALPPPLYAAAADGAMIEAASPFEHGAALVAARSELEAVRAELRAAEAAKEGAGGEAVATLEGALAEAVEATGGVTASLSALLEEAMLAASDGATFSSSLRLEKVQMSVDLGSALHRMETAEAAASRLSLALHAAEAKAAAAAEEVGRERIRTQANAAAAAESERGRRAAVDEVTALRAQYELQNTPLLTLDPYTRSAATATRRGPQSSRASAADVTDVTDATDATDVTPAGVHTGGTWSPATQTAGLPTLPASSPGGVGGAGHHRLTLGRPFGSSYVDVTNPSSPNAAVWSSREAWEQAARTALLAAVQGAVLADLLDSAREAFAVWYLVVTEDVHAAAPAVEAPAPRGGTFQATYAL